MSKIDLLRTDLPESDIDIFTISESWLNKETEEKLTSIPKYNITRLDRQTKHDNGQIKTGGGLCIYYKETLQIDPDRLAKLNVSNKILELQWVIVSRPNTKKIIIGNIYRPPGGNLKEAFQLINDTISEIENLEKFELLLIGDFNADASDDKLPQARIIKQFEAEQSLKQLINKPTRYSHTKRATIDLAFSNIKHCTSTGTLNYNISDHKPIFVIKKKLRNDTKTSIKWGRSYTNYNKEQLAETLRENISKQKINHLDPNAYWDELVNCINKAADKHCPMVKMKIRDTSAPFINKELRELQSDRDYFCEKADLSQEPGDRFIANCMIKIARKQVKKAKADYFLNQAIIHNQNHKKFWYEYKKIQPKSKQAVSNIIDDKTGERIEDKQLPNNINNYFIEIGENLAKKCQQINEEDKLFHPTVNENVFTLNKVDEGVIKCKILKLDKHKPSGLVNINSAFVQQSMVTLAKEFTHLFNLIIASGIFPDKWKSAVVTPIPKVPNPKSCNELRPISILPLPGRLMEQIIHDQIKEFLEGSNFFAKEQNGFRSKHSTTKALSEILDQLLTNMDNGELSISVFLDLKKAFDTIDHLILLNKLKTSGIDQDTCQLIKNYLTNRTQITKINGFTSQKRIVTTGVPQGSTLGPLLFLIFINDLPRITDSAKFILFADDAVLTVKNNSSKNAEKIMNGIFKNVHQWCAENKLTLNTSKTEYVIFGTKQKKKNSQPIELRIGENILKEVDSYKYLGTVLDGSLNVGPQIARLNQTLASKLNSFRKMRFCMSEKTAAYIYKATILPIIDYNDIIYGLMTKQQEIKLQRIQNRALRIIHMGKKLSTEEMHNISGISYLTQRRDQHLLALMFKRACKKEYLDKTIRVTRQGNSKILLIPKPKTNKFMNAPIYKGSKIWNNLPSKIRNASSFLVFKSLVRSYQSGLASNCNDKLQDAPNI